VLGLGFPAGRHPRLPALWPVAAVPQAGKVVRWRAALSRPLSRRESLCFAAQVTALISGEREGKGLDRALVRRRAATAWPEAPSGNRSFGSVFPGGRADSATEWRG